MINFKKNKPKCVNILHITFDLIDLSLLCSYINNVLAEEAVTFLIMELEGCDYRTATGLALGTRTPIDTLYYDGWQELLNKKKSVHQ